MPCKKKETNLECWQKPQNKTFSLHPNVGILRKVHAKSIYLHVWAVRPLISNGQNSFPLGEGQNVITHLEFSHKAALKSFPWDQV